tara:strand:+ start:2052 stop:2285 length:234 start_codon:yes stop_codon:yes gene_type:complete
MKNNEWLIGRQEIATYSRVSKWTVTAMIHAGLRCSGGKIKGSEPRARPEWVDIFFETHPNFVASHYHGRKPKHLKMI